MATFKRIVKRVLGGAALLLVLVCAWNWRDLRAFPSIISAYYAKEFCSCYFITGHDEAFCHAYTRQYVPISSFALDREHKTVTVSGLLRTSQAVYTGQRTGCELR